MDGMTYFGSFRFQNAFQNIIFFSPRHQIGKKSTEFPIINLITNAVGYIKVSLEYQPNSQRQRGTERSKSNEKVCANPNKTTQEENCHTSEHITISHQKISCILVNTGELSEII